MRACRASSGLLGLGDGAWSSATARGRSPGADPRLVLRGVVDLLAVDGIVLRDLERGLIDFPATAPSGRDHWLCWLSRRGAGRLVALARGRLRRSRPLDERPAGVSAAPLGAAGRTAVTCGACPATSRSGSRPPVADGDDLRARSWPACWWRRRSSPAVDVDRELHRLDELAGRRADGQRASTSCIQPPVRGRGLRRRRRRLLRPGELAAARGSSTVGEGIPITLSIVADRGRPAGRRADLVGVGLPGHFLLGDPRRPDDVRRPVLGRCACSTGTPAGGCSSTCTATTRRVDRRLPRPGRAPGPSSGPGARPTSARSAGPAVTGGMLVAVAASCGRRIPGVGGVGTRSSWPRRWPPSGRFAEAAELSSTCRAERRRRPRRSTTSRWPPRAAGPASTDARSRRSARAAGLALDRRVK